MKYISLYKTIFVLINVILNYIHILMKIHVYKAVLHNKINLLNIIQIIAFQIVANINGLQLMMKSNAQIHNNAKKIKEVLYKIINVLKNVIIL